MTYEQVEPIAQKAPLVQEVFERADRYLTRRRYDIHLRSTVVKELLTGASFKDILDIGCGDGSISLGLLSKDRRVTLLDFSKTMLAAAWSSVPNDRKDQVEVRQEDFMSASFQPNSFDLIICLGVLAHVDSPSDFIAKVRGLLRPQGCIVLEFTDAFHFMGRLARILGRIKKFAAPPRYQVNLLSASMITNLLAQHGLNARARYRYAMPPIPGMRLLGHRALYSLLRLMYGRPGKNRLARTGNEYICLLRADPPRAEDLL